VGDGPPVTWLAVRFGRGPIAIIAALPEQARAEAAPDAWFTALERSASTSILPPESALTCADDPGYVRIAWPRGDGEPGSELDLRATEDVVAALEERGLSAPPNLPEAEHYAIWSWGNADAEQTTRALRIVGASAPLDLRPSLGFPLLVSSITRGPQQLPDERGGDQLSLELRSGPESDYHARVRDWLTAHDEPLLETRARGPLFDWSILKNVVSLPPLADTYGRAAARELHFDADACVEQLRQLRDEEAASAAACGEARDFELSLAAAGHERATLERWVLSGALGFSPERLEAGGDARLPVLRARTLNGAKCGDEPPPRIVDGPSEGGGTKAGPSTPVVVEDTVVVEQAPASDIGCSCSPGRDPYYDDRDTSSCSSDTSSDSGTDDACSGDSSSSSDDDACSGDSSSSSSDQDGCASDSSNSSRDSGCDGGSEEQGYDGDTCTGSAAPGALREQKRQAALTARPRRVKTSLWSLSLVALALPIRRRKRRKI
jgi:hypothetical protein